MNSFETAMDSFESKIILTLADQNMNITAAARVLFMHRNSVLYHIRKIKKATGLDATVFYDLCKLTQEVKQL